MGSLDIVGARACLFVSGVCVILWWVLAFQESGWSQKVSLIYKVDIGLFKVDIGKGFVGHITSFLGGKSTMAIFKPHVHNTRDFAEYLCGIAAAFPLFHHSCHIGNFLDIGSMFMLFCILCGTVMTCIASGMLLMWLQHPRAEVRFWLRFFYGMSPIAYIVGLTVYSLAAEELSGLPPANSGLSMGPCAILAWLLTAISWIPWWLATWFVHKSAEEALNEHLSYEHKEAREEQRLMNYQQAAQSLSPGFGAGYTYGAPGQYDPGPNQNPYHPGHNPAYQAGYNPALGMPQPLPVGF